MVRKMRQGDADGVVVAGGTGSKELPSDTQAAHTLPLPHSICSCSA